MKEYEGESESEKGYWADIYYYMEKYNCDKETAIKNINIIYDNYSKKLKQERKQ